MSNRPTPLTDAAEHHRKDGTPLGRVVPAELTRTLERELGEAVEVLKGWRNHVDFCNALNSAYAESACSCGYLKARAFLQRLGA